MGGLRALATAALYLVLKSNGPHRSKNFPVKFVFSPIDTPTNIVKKLPSRCCSKPLFIAFFNFSHKRPTFAFTGESGYTLGFQRKIAHKGTHGKTVAFPPSDTAGLCAASEIALSAAFVTLDSAMLLYTYISRFSANPHYQQQLYLRPSFIAFFNFLHKWPTFAFTSESVHTRLSEKNRTQGRTRRNRWCFGWGWYHYPRSVPHVSETLRGQGVERRTWPLLGLGRGALPKNAESLRNSDVLMRVAVPRRLGPAGLRDPVAIVSMIKNIFNPWVGSFLDFLLGKYNFYQKGHFTTLLIRRNRWLLIFQPRLVDFWRAFW